MEEEQYHLQQQVSWSVGRGAKEVMEGEREGGGWEGQGGWCLERGGGKRGGAAGERWSQKGEVEGGEHERGGFFVGGRGQ